MGLSRDHSRLLFLALIALILLLTGCQGRPDPEVAAEVSGYRITFSELERYLQTQFPDLTDPASEDQDQMLRLTVFEGVDRPARDPSACAEARTHGRRLRGSSKAGRPTGAF